MNMIQIIYTILELGLLYSIVSIALVISFKIIKFPDLSVDGIFSLGGAISATFIVELDNSLLGFFFSILGGILAGLATASLNLYFNVNKILSGILVMISLYSINIRIMNKSNVPIIDNITFLSYFEKNEFFLISFLLVLVLVIVYFLFLLLKTDIGLYLRAIGDNYKVVTDNGRNYKLFVLFGMGVSGGLIGLAGGLVAIRQGFADINMGVGIIIIGLACLYIGESIIKVKNLFFLFISAVIGTLVYQAVISIGLSLGLRPSDLKILTALMVVLAISLKTKPKSYTDGDII